MAVNELFNCPGGIVHFLKEDILNNKKPPKNVRCTTLQGTPPVPPAYIGGVL